MKLKEKPNADFLAAHNWACEQKWDGNPATLEVSHRMGTEGYLAGVAHGRQNPDWRPASEKPKEVGWYLATRVRLDGSKIVQKTNYGGEQHGWVGFVDVVAWCPLPNPPEFEGASEDGPTKSCDDRETNKNTWYSFEFSIPSGNGIQMNVMSDKGLTKDYLDKDGKLERRVFVPIERLRAASEQTFGPLVPGATPEEFVASAEKAAERPVRPLDTLADMHRKYADGANEAVSPTKSSDDTCMRENSQETLKRILGLNKPMSDKRSDDPAIESLMRERIGPLLSTPSSARKATPQLTEADVCRLARAVAREEIRGTRAHSVITKKGNSCFVHGVYLEPRESSDGVDDIPLSPLSDEEREPILD